MSTIETPEEMAARLFPGQRGGSSTMGIYVAEPAIRADRETIAAALREEADAAAAREAWRSPTTDGAEEVLRAFADRLVPQPTADPAATIERMSHRALSSLTPARPIAELGDPVAMAETSRAEQIGRALGAAPCARCHARPASICDLCGPCEEGEHAAQQAGGARQWTAEALAAPAPPVSMLDAERIESAIAGAGRSE